MANLNKRQKKKQRKHYLLIIADEANLLTMTEEERKKAYEDYKKFEERFAYRKKYKDLKEGKPLHYYFPFGETATSWMKELSMVARKPQHTSYVVTQSLDDFKKA